MPDKQRSIAANARLEPSATEAQPQQQALFHRRDAEFIWIGVFFDQELFTLRPQRLSLENCG